LGDESELGLDIDGDSTLRSSDVAFCMDMQAAIHFCGTQRSFIPSGLLGDASEKAPQITPEQAVNAQILPKLEYTKQFTGIKKDSMPPLSMAPNMNKARRRCSNQYNPAAA